ncbi:permease [Streptomyces coeruleoprunus]|uniref:Permease n=1 Tax=Streptomyces coeruleoprunus TaxID=285563 RepID=A0ABV9XJZ8_9ACTN
MSIDTDTRRTPGEEAPATPAAPEGPWRRLRFWALCAAAAAVAVVALGAVAAVATHDGREARNEARGPVITERPQEAVALWREAVDAVGDVPHTVIYLHPLKPGAQPPPGLPRWPAPGEAVLSPELAEQGRQDGITDRYGRFAGTIDGSGLMAPSERFAYVRTAQAPDLGDGQPWMYVRGFGETYPMGEALYARPLSRVLLGLGVLTGVPALVLLVVAARVRTRGDGLRFPEGPWHRRVLLAVREAALPVAAGTALALLPWLAAVSTDIALPPTGYALNSADLGGAWPLAGLALLLSFALTLAVAAVAAVARSLRADGEEPVAAPLPAPVPRWRLIGCGAGVAAIAVSQYLTGDAAPAVFLGGTVVMWVMLPSVVVLAARKLGDALAARGSGAGRAGQRTAGRWTAAHPGPAVRLTTFLVVGLGLISLLQVLNGDTGDKAAAARSTEARIGQSVLSVQSREMTPAIIASFTRSLPAGSHVLALNTAAGQQESLLQGSCAALRSLRLDCPATPRTATGGDRRFWEIRNWYGPTISVQAAANGLRTDKLRGSLIVLTGSPGGRAEVERAAYALLPAVNVETFGETWLVGAATKERQNNWVLLFGSLGLALLLLAGGVSAAAEFARHYRGRLTDRHKDTHSLAFWYLTVPLVAATVLAVAVTAWHAVFFIALLQGGGFSSTALAATVGGGALVAWMVGHLSGRAATRLTS